ncbi:MAG: dienelactone hydrolase family protein [Planctomycetota bacterium]
MRLHGLSTFSLLVAATVLVGLVPGQATAQRVEVLSANTLRFELGQRLRALEVSLESKRDDSVAIARAMPIVDQAVKSFFGLSLDRAAERLDAARFALETDREVERQHARLAFLPQTRLVDPDETGSLTISHGWVYGHGREGEQSFGADGVRYRIEHRLVDGGGASVGEPVSVVFSDLRPAEIELPLPDFSRDMDLTLESSVAPLDTEGLPVVDAPPITRRCTVSIVRNAIARIAEIEPLAERTKGEGTATIAATASHYSRMFRILGRGRAFETDVPVARLLAEAEAMARHLESATGNYFDRARTGERWMRLSVPSGRRVGRESVVPLRLWTPDGIAEGDIVPLVIALHGAGGSENMFFDGYGDGLARRLAEERGWAFASPLTQTASPDLVAMIDELAKRYPIDTEKVFVFGHSMGAAKTVDLLQVGAGRFAAASALGGSGRVRRESDFAGLPVFVGCGSRDFALNGARVLHQAFEQAGAESELKIYDDVEHLTVVQIALPEVFAFFDQWAAR